MDRTSLPNPSRIRYAPISALSSLPDSLHSPEPRVPEITGGDRRYRAHYRSTWPANERWGVFQNADQTRPYTTSIPAKCVVTKGALTSFCRFVIRMHQSVPGICLMNPTCRARGVLLVQGPEKVLPVTSWLDTPCFHSQVAVSKLILLYAARRRGLCAPDSPSTPCSSVALA